MYISLNCVCVGQLQNLERGVRAGAPVLGSAGRAGLLVRSAHVGDAAHRPGGGQLQHHLHPAQLPHGRLPAPDLDDVELCQLPPEAHA